MVEILIAGLILGVTIVGLALMLSHGQAFVVAQGDSRVALYLAQQKVEKLIAAGFAATATGDQTSISGCATIPPTEPCYSETIQAGEVVGASTQTFTRFTCVRYVKDDDPDNPAWGAPPACPVDCTLSSTCQKQTMRVRVTVNPQMKESDPVTLETVLTGSP